MNTPSPLIPQGTFPPNRSKSQIRIAVFAILAVHVVLLGALLMAGCKKTTDTTDAAGFTNTYDAASLQPADTNLTPGISATQAAAPVPVLPPGNLLTGIAPTVPPQTSSFSTLPPPLPGDGMLAPASEHVIIKGESFYTVGKKYGVSYRAIAEANPGVDPTRLKIGQKIKIPPPTTTASLTPSAATAMGGVASAPVYVVKSGDNLLKIAKTHGVSVKALRSANNLRTDQIKVGQKLKIPARNGVSPVDSAVTAAPPVSPAPASGAPGTPVSQ